ncbi:hypothetical protein HORIV_49420 [Vreelandella olivaria]|uniref:SMP domain-containing protein n=1 Tax=Vreelandella olivaria TaxID=390919 RepID=A0ABM7GL12_9GAMM|nr:hypothetical protein HORIV_49420 [Halomonas olivaria]
MAPIPEAHAEASQLRRTKAVVDATTAKKAQPNIAADASRTGQALDMSGNTAPTKVTPLSIAKARPCR